MKKIILSLLLVSATSLAFSQYEKEDEEEKKGGFKKENLFVGGSATASFFNGSTVLGINPYFGYSINKFLDVALVANVTYAGERDFSGGKYRQWVYGPGAFVRIFPVKMVFLHAGVERNFISLKYIPPSNSNAPTDRFKVQSNSVLLGAGFASDRDEMRDFFYYISLVVDVNKSPYSPYTEQLQDGSIRMQPIFRAGIQIPLFKKGGIE